MDIWFILICSDLLAVLVGRHRQETCAHKDCFFLGAHL